MTHEESAVSQIGNAEDVSRDPRDAYPTYPSPNNEKNFTSFLYLIVHRKLSQLASLTILYLYTLKVDVIENVSVFLSVNSHSARSQFSRYVSVV